MAGHICGGEPVVYSQFVPAGREEFTFAPGVVGNYILFAEVLDSNRFGLKSEDIGCAAGVAAKLEAEDEIGVSASRRDNSRAFAYEGAVSDVPVAFGLVAEIPAVEVLSVEEEFCGAEGGVELFEADVLEFEELGSVAGVDLHTEESFFAGVGAVVNEFYGLEAIESLDNV